MIDVDGRNAWLDIDRGFDAGWDRACIVMNGGGVGRDVSWGSWLSGVAASPWIGGLRLSDGMMKDPARCWMSSGFRIDGSSGLCGGCELEESGASGRYVPGERQSQWIASPDPRTSLRGKDIVRRAILTWLRGRADDGRGFLCCRRPRYSWPCADGVSPAKGNSRLAPDLVRCSNWSERLAFAQFRGHLMFSMSHGFIELARNVTQMWKTRVGEIPGSIRSGGLLEQERNSR